MGTRIRIKLVIPPYKKRSLILEGEVIRLIMPGSSKSSTNYLNEFIIDNETSKNNNVNDDDEYFLQLQGEIWIEEEEDNNNDRKKLGTFSAVKLPTPNKSQLRYAIPPPKR